MILVDSSGWVEYFVDGPLADAYAARLRTPANLITPTIVLYEVYKRLQRDLTPRHANTAVAAMRRTEIVPLDAELALRAADLSMAERLSMADAIVLATARARGAELVTSDADFKNVTGVTYLSKRA
ncbi:MAG TPA: type II toxin-antitoxin system VapC family toxin [Thermoanaerobaculia bacterium]|nr:type II toxin-antitoxin system VapC family toxin [Thermoanaerobaculia bacterium]